MMGNDLKAFIAAQSDATYRRLEERIKYICTRIYPPGSVITEQSSLMGLISAHGSWGFMQGREYGRLEAREAAAPPAPGPYTHQVRAREEQRTGGPWQVIEETYHKGKDGKIAPPDTKPIAGHFAEFGGAMAVQERLKAEREHEMEELHRRMYNKALPFWPWVRYRVRRARPGYASPFVGLTDERASYEASVRKMPDTMRDFGLHTTPDVIVPRKPADHAEAD